MSKVYSFKTYSYPATNGKVPTAGLGKKFLLFLTKAKIVKTENFKITLKL